MICIRHKLQLGKHDLYSFSQAMLSVPKEVRDHLLLHQVLSGLPDTGNWQLRAAGKTKDLAALLERAQVLMMIIDQQQTAAIV